MFVITATVKHTLSPSQCKKKEIQGIHIGKEEIKLFIYVDNMLIYIRTPKSVEEKL